MNRFVLGTVVSLLLMGSSSAAVLEMNGSPGRGGRMPPPEAIEACKGKDEGTAVEITTPRGDTLKATCQQRDGQLIAVPEGGFRSPKGSPPEDAVSGQ